MKPWLRQFTLALLAQASVTVSGTDLHAQSQADGNPPKAPPGCGPRVIVEYTDDDPDYFIIKNRSPQGWSLVRLGIDLQPTSGNLVFDTDEGGEGVGGAAGFYAGTSPTVRLVGTIPAEDGGKGIALSFEGFDAGQDFNFSIDLDSLARDGGTTWVLPQDMMGGRILATFRGPTGQEDKIDAIFDDMAEADSGAGGCV